MEENSERGTKVKYITDRVIQPANHAALARAPPAATRLLQGARRHRERVLPVPQTHAQGTAVDRRARHSLHGAIGGARVLVLAVGLTRGFVGTLVVLAPVPPPSSIHVSVHASLSDETRSRTGTCECDRPRLALRATGAR